MAAAKKVKSPTGRPSKKKEAVKDFEKGDAGGGSRKSAYTKKKTTAKKPASKSKAKPSMLGTGTARKAAEKLTPAARKRREKKAGA